MMDLMVYYKQPIHIFEMINELTSCLQCVAVSPFEQQGAGELNVCLIKSNPNPNQASK